MATALISHPECRLHEMGPAHPDCPRRIDVIMDQLLALRVLDFLMLHDAHADDISDLMFSDADYLWLTKFAKSVAETHAAGRLVSVLEGGYELDSLARCAAAHVRALAEL